jgi:uncharacterized delta-60 repeat protein
VTPRYARGAIALLATAALAITADSAPAAPGALDPSFDLDGKRVLPYAGSADTVLTQPDGKVVVAGTSGGNFAVWRLKPGGEPDPAFDKDGLATVDTAGIGELTAAALQPDGKVLVAGEIHEVKGTSIYVKRLNADGSPDKTFDAGGGAMLAAGLQSVAAVLVQRDGKIVLAGRNGDDFGLLRMYSTGTTDGTVFDEGQFGGADAPDAAALQPDGKIVVAGTSRPVEALAPAPKAVVARYRSDGKLDQDFGAAGKATLGAGESSAVLVQRDGKVVVQTRTAEDDSRTLVTRLTAKGGPDTAFGHGGTAIVDLHGPDAPAGVALHRDGKLLVAGTAGYDFSAARLTAGGAFDASYGGTGGSLFGFSGVNRAAASALQADGKLLVAGYAVIGGAPHVAIARLLADAPPKTGGGPAGPTPRAPRCAGHRATIVGTAGRDTLRGTRHADVIVALGGNDRVLARRGNDIVCGGSGRDRLLGGPGRDRLIGGPGRDRLIGGPGRDRLR